MIGFQNDAYEMALSANQIEAERLLTNQTASLEHHFDNCVLLKTVFRKSSEPTIKFASRMIKV